jgi:hypothetical protein
VDKPKLPKLPDLDKAWAWWNEHISFETKAALAVLAVVGLVIGGWLAATGLSSAHATDAKKTTASTVVEAVRTVERVVTVREPGKVIKERVPVVKRIYEQPKQSAKRVAPTRTVYQTATVLRTVPSYHSYPVTAPARTVTQVVTTTVEHVEWRVVKVVNPVTVTVTVPSP